MFSCYRLDFHKLKEIIDSCVGPLCSYAKREVNKKISSHTLNEGCTRKSLKQTIDALIKTLLFLFWSCWHFSNKETLIIDKPS